MRNNRDSDFSWRIIGTGFINLAIVYGIWYSFSVFFVALLKEFGWSRSITAGAFSLFVILHSIIGPFVGRMVDRFGPRNVILAGSLILGVGLAMCSVIQSWLQFYLFFGVITAVGVAAAGLVPNITLVQLWFKAKRGLAIGIVLSGVGVGILVCVPFFQLLITLIGWRMTYQFLALFIPLIVISAAILFVKKPPEDSLSRPIEKDGSSPTKRDYLLIVNKEWVSQHWTVRRAITEKRYWLLSLSFFLASFATQSILTHHFVFFVDQGLETLFASYIVGMIGLVSIGAKIVWGTLSDKIGREVTYTIGITCSIFGIIFLVAFSVLSSSSLPYFYALFFGMGYAVQAALPPLITADFFEGETYGEMFGTLMLLHGIGGALGAWFAGFLHDQMGSYFLVFVIMIACAFVSCLSLWWAAPRKIRIVLGKSCNIDFPGNS